MRFAAAVVESRNRAEQATRSGIHRGNTSNCAHQGISDSAELDNQTSAAYLECPAINGQSCGMPRFTQRAKSKTLVTCTNLLFFSSAECCLLCGTCGAAEKSKSEQAGPHAVARTEQEVAVVFTVRIIHNGKKPLQDAADSHAAAGGSAAAGHRRSGHRRPAAARAGPLEGAGGRLSAAGAFARPGVDGPLGRRVPDPRASMESEGPARRTACLRFPPRRRPCISRDAKNFALNDPAIKAAAREATAGRRDDVAKLEGIHDFVIESAAVQPRRPLGSGARGSRLGQGELQRIHVRFRGAVPGRRHSGPVRRRHHRPARQAAARRSGLSPLCPGVRRGRRLGRFRSDAQTTARRATASTSAARPARCSCSAPATAARAR